MALRQFGGGSVIGSATPDTYLSAATKGLALNGSTNDSAAFTTAVSDAVTASKPLLITGNGRLGTAVTLNTSTRIKGIPGAKLTIATSGLGIDIKPTGVSAGNVAAAAVGATTVTVSGAGWTVNGHAGKWAEIYDATVNAVSGDATAHVRRILSNTADTLTLEHAIGYAIPAGATLTLYTPLDEVDLSDLTIDRTTTGGANIAIRYARNVRLSNVSIDNAGNYTASSGNGIAIYNCDKVRMVDCTINRAGNFGAFIYNCDNVRVDRPTVKHWGGQFGIQLKDCRNGVVSGATIVADGTKGDNAISLKCSGLNPGFDLKAVDCRAENVKQSSFEFSSITNEGSGFSAQNFRFVRCSSHKAQTSGFTVVTDATSAYSGLAWVDCMSTESTQYGYSASVAKGIKIVNCTARLNRFEGVHVGTSDVEIVGGLYQDNAQAYTTGASRSSEIYLDAAALRTTIRGVTFRRTSAGKALRAVRELAGANNTLIQDCRIREEVAGYTQDYLISGAGSKAIGWNATDTFTGAPTVNKDVYTVV